MSVKVWDRLRKVWGTIALSLKLTLQYLRSSGVFTSSKVNPDDMKDEVLYGSRMRDCISIDCQG